MQPDEFERLAGLLLPEHRPYLVTSSQQPTGAETITRNCYGVTGHNIDKAFAPWLRSQGRWEGRRRTIWLDDVTLVDEARQRLLGLLVHEMAHLADCQPDDEQSPTELSGALVAVAAQFADINAEHYKIPLWTGHDAAWIRRCCHLRYRLERDHGQRVDCWAIYNAEQYELPSCQAFDDALRVVNEYENLHRVPLGEIDTFLPPYLFRSLWHNFLDRWEQDNPDATQQALGILARGRALYPRRLEHERDWQ